jgi:hypothetical protein
MSHYLSIVLFTPLAGAFILLLVNKQNENAIRWIANVVAFIGFVIGSNRKAGKTSGFLAKSMRIFGLLIAYFKSHVVVSTGALKMFSSVKGTFLLVADILEPSHLCYVTISFVMSMNISLFNCFKASESFALLRFFFIGQCFIESTLHEHCEPSRITDYFTFHMVTFNTAKKGKEGRSLMRASRPSSKADLSLEPPSL